MSPSPAPKKAQRTERRPSAGTLLTARSIEFDAILVAHGTGGLTDIKTAAPGILATDTMVAKFTGDLIKAIGQHRVWDRAPLVMASAGPAA